MTTNGSLLAKKASSLRDAGLSRVTVSLDSLDAETFRTMSDVKIPRRQGVGRSIPAAAADAGLAPVKVNTVVKRGLNDGQGLLDLAAFGREHGYIVVRFIEFMDVGATNGWRMDDVVPAAEIVAAINTQWPIEPVDPAYVGEVAARYRYLDGAGEVGMITSISQPSAAPAPGLACPPRVSCTPACSPGLATTSARRCARGPVMTTWKRGSPASGRVEPTATQPNAPPRPSASRRSK